MRKVLFTVFFVVSVLMPSFAFDLDPIAKETNITIILNCSGQLLESLMKATPVLSGEKISKFLSSASIEPTNDITRAQIMISKGASKSKDSSIVILTGSFKKDKIIGFIEGTGGKEVEKSENIGFFKSAKGNSGICIIDSNKFIFGDFDIIKTFLKNKDGEEKNMDYAEMTTLLQDKTIAAVLIRGEEFLKNAVSKGKVEKLAKIFNAIENPDGIFVQLTENSLELRNLYTKNNSKNQIKSIIQADDPAIHLEKIFMDLLEKAEIDNW